MRLIIFIIFFCYFQTSPKVITIDASRNDKLNISQIAEEVIAIPLKDIPMNEPFLTKLIVTSDHLFVCLSEGGFGREKKIFQVKRDGTLIRQVGIKSEEANDFSIAYVMAHLENTNELAISYENYVAIFDIDGKFKRKIDNVILEGLTKVYNNKIWKYSLISEPEAKVYNWISRDLTTLQYDTLYEYKHLTPTAMGVFAGSSFCVADNKLYFNIDYENELVSVNRDNQVEKSYRFEFRNMPENYVDSVIHPERIVFNNYIYYGYRDYSKKNFCYIYNKTNGESYNLKLHIKDNAYVTGINDDIYNTGYFRLNKTNSGNYAYDTKFGYQVSDKIPGIENESNPVIFLIKLK